MYALDLNIFDEWLQYDIVYRENLTVLSNFIFMSFS